jgi:hypothetical protein
MRADPRRSTSITRKPITILKSGVFMPMPENNIKYERG